MQLVYKSSTESANIVKFWIVFGRGWPIRYIFFFLSLPFHSQLPWRYDIKKKRFLSVRGCPAAVLRMWYSISSTPIELCGVKTSDKWTYLSEDNNMRLRFVVSLRSLIIHKSNELRSFKKVLEHWFFSFFFFLPFSFILADKAVGQLGFKAIWTEVSTNTDCQNQFFCSKNKYCIAESLRCNEVYNCGPADNSDEENCKFRKR